MSGGDFRQYERPELDAQGIWEPAATTVAAALAEKYRLSPSATYGFALNNFRDVTFRFSRNLRNLVNENRLTSEQITQRIVQPDLFPLVLQTLLKASETNEATPHELLARILGARLVSTDHSSKALLARAAEAIGGLTNDLSEVLGLIYTLFAVEPQEDYRSWLIEQFIAWISVVEEWMAPYDDVSISEEDLKYLEQIGALHIHNMGGSMFGYSEVAGYSRLLAPLNLAWQGLQNQYRSNHHVVRALGLMESEPKEGKRGLDSITLTPVGFTLGSCVSSIHRRTPFLSQT